MTICKKWCNCFVVVVQVQKHSTMDRPEKKPYLSEDCNSFEDGKINCNVEEVVDHSCTSDSILRNRRNQNDTIEKDMRSDAKIISEMIGSVKDKELKNSPKTYLKIYMYLLLRILLIYDVQEHYSTSPSQCSRRPLIRLLKGL